MRDVGGWGTEALGGMKRGGKTNVVVVEERSVERSGRGGGVGGDVEGVT